MILILPASQQNIILLLRSGVWAAFDFMGGAINPYTCMPRMIYII